MKIVLIIFCAVMSSIYLHGQTDKKSMIQIGSVNIYTNTSFSVACENFYPSFETSIIYREVFSADTLKMLEGYLNKIKYLRRQGSIDVRAKYIYVNVVKGERTDICIDNFSVMVNGRIIKKNKRLQMFIKSLLPNQQLQYPTKPSQ